MEEGGEHVGMFSTACCARWSGPQIMRPHSNPMAMVCIYLHFYHKNQAKVGTYVMDGMGQAIVYIPKWWIPKWWICILNTLSICIWMLWFGHSTLDATSRFSCHMSHTRFHHLVIWIILDHLGNLTIVFWEVSKLLFHSDLASLNPW